MDTKHLIQIRARFNVTQEVMADYLQCDVIGYRRYENGTRVIPRYIARSALLLEFVHTHKLLKKFELFIAPG
jgi:DNA-binding transcriptional regulator YiaG